MSGFYFKALMLVVILCPMLANAEIYRWTDETGKVHYSDKKPTGVVAEKKAYVNVATPWRKVPRPVQASEALTKGGLTADVAAKQQDVPLKEKAHTGEELSKGNSDQKAKKEKGS